MLLAGSTRLLPKDFIAEGLKALDALGLSELSSLRDCRLSRKYTSITCHQLALLIPLTVKLFV